MSELKELYNMIVTQRAWSWTFLGILDLFLFLMIRGIFFHSLVKRAKSLNSKWYHELKKTYAKYSLGGWLIFLVSLLLVIFSWQTANLKTFSLYEAGLSGLILVTLFFAAMAHVTALGNASIHVLRQLEKKQMTL